MKCDNLDNIVILALVFSLLSDLFALFAGLVNRKCNKQNEQQQKKTEKKVQQELADLRQRVALLEKQISAPAVNSSK